MSHRRFGRSLLGAMVVVVTLAVAGVGLTQVTLFDRWLSVPGADAFDPTTMAWSGAAVPTEPSESHPSEYPELPGEALDMTVFADGSALAVPVTGYDAPSVAPSRSVQWYDRERWQELGVVERRFDRPAMVRLGDGRIVVVDEGMSLVVDPSRGTLTPAPAPPAGSFSGHVIAAGGRVYALVDTEGALGGAMLVPGEGTWETVPRSPSQRMGSRIMGLGDGRLVLAGGLAEGRALRADGVLWMGLLLVVVVVIGLLSIRALRRGVHRVGTIVGAGLGGLLAGLGWLWLLVMSAAPHGRPLRLGRRTWRGRVCASATRRAGGGLSWPTRSILARAWSRDAALEHASVAAFEQLARSLEAVGAPPELVTRARAAAAEEAEHARVCLALASRHAERELALVPLPVLPGVAMPGRRGGLDREARLERLAVESFVDGALGEGWAAASAAEALRETTDPEARCALALIARDEASHAAHARDVLAWCLAEGGERVRGAVRRVAERERARVRFRGLPVRRWTDGLAQHGRFREARPGTLDAGLRARLSRAGW